MATTTISAGTKKPELEFARYFVGRLNEAKITRQADYVKDPRNYSRGPPALLPALIGTNPPSKPASSLPIGTIPSSSSSSSPSAAVTSVTLTTLKPPKTTHTLLSLPIHTTSILDIKSKLSPLLSTPTVRIPVSGLRILHKRKPVSDAKILSEIILSDTGAGGGNDDYISVEVLQKGIDMSFMVTKEEPVVVEQRKEAEEDEEPAMQVPEPSDAIPDQDVPMKDVGSAPETTTRRIVETEEFWGDLHGFLLHKLKNEDQAKETLAVFRGAIEKR